VAFAALASQTSYENVSSSPNTIKRICFGLKKSIVELQGFRRSEEQIKIFDGLCQHEALHFVAVLFADHVGKRSIAGVRAAISNKVVEQCFAHLPILPVTGAVIKIISGLHDLGTEMITSGNDAHCFII